MSVLESPQEKKIGGYMGGYGKDAMRAANLSRVLNPKSIALVGATPRSGSFSARTLDNLAGYRGELFLVNKKYETIGDRPCFPALSDLPVIVDSAIIALPAPLVEEAALQCADAGVGGAIIYASGYAEMGDADSAERQARLTGIADRTGMRVIGPNCMGVVNYANSAIQSFQQFPRLSPNNGRSIGLVSQSGALALALSQAVERGMSFSHILTFGNGADVDLGDMVGHLAHDPDCRVIACVFEGLANPRSLLRAAAAAKAAGKPLVICKLATSEAGAKAALSHTGTLAGSHKLYQAFLEHEDAILVDRLDCLLEVASFFAKAPPCQERGVAIVAASGGAGIMAVDKAEQYGVALPQPHPRTRAVVAENIPAFGSASNPCDVTAEVVNRPDSLAACMHAMASDENYGAVIVPHTVAGSAFTPRLQIYSEVAKAYSKPVCAVWLSEWKNGPGSTDFESDPYVSVFSSMDNCLLALQRWHERASSSMEPVPAEKAASDAVTARKSVDRLLGRIADGNILTESESKKALADYGVTINKEALAATLEDALRTAGRMGYPVALKVLSPDILHKTEAGAVALGISDSAQLEDAYRQLSANIGRLSPRPRVQGFLVQEMVPQGVEILVGAKVDQQFGPFLVVGHGGILVELIQDALITPVPVSPSQAKALISRLKGQALLDGFRGRAGVDRDALADTISRISHFVANHADSLAELDVNPLICRENRIVAVDALIVTSPSLPQQGTTPALTTTKETS